MSARLLQSGCWALLLLAASARTSPVRADLFHYQGVLIGQRAIGLGGAFTGVADDPAAAFYNPAGLAQIAKDGISLSLSVNAFDRRTMKDALITDVGTTDLSHEGRPTVPVSATTILKLGKKDATGMRAHALAFSTFTRDRDDYVYDATLVDQLPANPMRRRAVEAELRIQRSELWYGPSYAYRISPRWHVGVSMFVSVLKLAAQSETTIMEGDALGAIKDTGTPAPNPRFQQTERSVDVKVKKMLLRIGALYKPSSMLSLGLMFQTPSLHIRSSGNITDRIVNLDGPSNVATFTQVERGLRAESPDPWEIRIGAGFQPTPWLLLSVDASVYGPTGSASNPQRTIEIHESENPDDVEPTPNRLFMPTWYRRPTGNLSIGTQVEAGRYLDLSAGFFTDFSAAPPIRETASSYSEPDVDHLGASWACGFHKDRYNVSVGLLALWGKGDGYALHVDAGPNDPPLTRTTVTDRTIMLFVYGYTRAIQRAAEDSYKAVQKRQEQRDKERLEAEQADD